MFTFNILLNTVNATYYYRDHGEVHIPSWAESANDHLKTFTVDSCYTSGSDAGAWKAGAWTNGRNLTHWSGHYPADSSASLQYMGVDFREYARIYNAEEVPLGWETTEWKRSNDEDLLRHSVQPLVDECAARCWMQDDCDQAYFILRVHKNSQFDDGVGANGVQGYEDIRSKMFTDYSKNQMMIAYCHMFNENIRSSGAVSASSDKSLWQAVNSDGQNDTDGDNFMTIVYQKPEAADNGFCGDNLCPYSTSTEKYFKGSLQATIMSDPLNRSVAGSELAKALEIIEDKKGLSLNELKDYCLSNDECVAVDFELADENWIGEQLYDARVYKFVNNAQSVTRAITSYKEAGSVHMNGNTYLPDVADGNGTMMKLAPCRDVKRKHIETIMASPSWILAPIIESE